MSPETDAPPPLRAIFATYVAAVAAIFALSGFAVLALTSAYPEVPERALLASLPGLLAGSLAASTALVLTLALIVRPLDPARLRLVPGRETGRALAIMVAGILTLGQALDSLTMLAGLGNRGTMALIRKALEGAAGVEIFAAVVVVGPIAGAVEEVFFRGWLQGALRRHWRPRAAVAATSLGFAVLHVDADAILVGLAFAVGIYLGVVTELAGSALPAVVCHVVNNALFTLQTILGATVVDRTANVVLAPLCALAFVACLLWLRRALPPAPSPAGR